MSELVPIAQPVADTLLTLLSQGVAIDGMDATKFEVMLRMYARIQFDRAMSDAQGEMQPVVRTIPNSATNSKYADLQAIDAAIRPIYSRHGFSLTFSEVPTEGATVRIACTVRREGHAETHYLEAASDTHGPQGKPNKTPIQGVVSAVTYLRRALTCMVFNVSTKGEDQDGNRTRDDGEIISPEQARELADLIAMCSADPSATTSNERAVLLKFGLGAVRSIKEVPPARFAQLRTALRAKRARIEASRQTGVAA